MKNRIFILILAAAVACSISACGSSAPTSAPADQTEKPEKNTQTSKTFDSFEAIEEAMALQTENAETLLTKTWDKLRENIGDTYEGYEANQEQIQKMNGLVLATSDQYYANMIELSHLYYQMIVDQVDMSDYDAWDDAMEDCYDAWDDNMEDYYDIWDNLLESQYDYLNELLEDATDTVEYSIVSDAWSDMYSQQSDTWSACYQKYNENWSILYVEYSTIWSGFYRDTTDISALLQEAAEEIERRNAAESELTESEEKTSTSEETETSEAASADGISPEFKKTMDAYEAFFDEYVEFMQNYDATDLKMLTEYAQMLEKYAKALEEMEELENSELSDEETLYFLEVQNRINEKLAKVALTM